MAGARVRRIVVVRKSVTDLPWEAERPIGVEEARALVGVALEIPCTEVHELGEGWDFVNFVADDEWVLRFPKRPDCDLALVRERDILDGLRRIALPVPVPHFEHFSAPCETFPWHFAAYRLLPGVPLSDVGNDKRRNDVAAELGEFLAILHTSARTPGLPSPWEAEDERTWLAREFESALPAYPADLKRRMERHLERAPVPAPSVPYVLAHADLLGEHILVDRATGRLSGIIDWADACKTLRSSDFAGLLYEGGREFAARAYAAYGVEPDEQEWRWLEQTAIAVGVGHVFYGYHRQLPRLVAQGLDRVRRYLPGDR